MSRQYSELFLSFIVMVSCLFVDIPMIFKFLVVFVKYG